jgi:hypothetical protein
MPTSPLSAVTRRGRMHVDPRVVEYLYSTLRECRYRRERERVDLNLSLGGLVVARWQGCRGRSASAGEFRLG